MKITILGSGGAAGVPAVSTGWGLCDPTNPKNRRLRSSILVETPSTRLLIDTSPDLREQLLTHNIKALDAILYTHSHADHLHGIDEVREINRAMSGPIDLWASPDCLSDIKSRFGYVLEPLNNPYKSIYKPLLNPRLIEGRFSVGDMDIIPIKQDHGHQETLGFRFGRMAYSTDLIRMPDESFDLLHDLDVWIIGCLTNIPEHPTHISVDGALEWIERLKPRRAIITHMGGKLDYETLKTRLPNHVEPAFDGMVIEDDPPRVNLRLRPTDVS